MKGPAYQQLASRVHELSAPLLGSSSKLLCHGAKFSQAPIDVQLAIWTQFMDNVERLYRQSMYNFYMMYI